jgi:hypothetical protein
VKVVDSSGGLEYFADGPNAGAFAEPLADPGDLVVPVVSVYEVFERMLVPSCTTPPCGLRTSTSRRSRACGT